MTPAQVARAALRLADCLYVIAEEMRREDVHDCIIRGAKADISAIWDDLHEARERHEMPVWNLLESSDRIEASADAWRTFGENLRAEVGHVA